MFKNLLFDIRTKAVSCPPREELFPSDNRDELLCDWLKKFIFSSQFQV